MATKKAAANVQSDAYIRLAAVDVGNDALKGIFGNLESELYIPNVISYQSSENREIVSDLDKKKPLQNIHVKITSPALKQSGVYFVGDLATHEPNKNEVDLDSVKAESDQTIVMLLTSLAFDAVESKKFITENGKLSADYHLGTGLPMREIKADKKLPYKAKLEKGPHLVEFLQTPLYGGITVEINFKHVEVQSEGFAAFMNLTMDENLGFKRPELFNQRVIIQDIGGLSTDIAVIEESEVIDTKSEGYNLGMSAYLDRIRTEVLQKFSEDLGSRKEVAKVLTRKQDRNHIKVAGTRTSIEPIVKENLGELAVQQYKYLNMTWKNNSQTDIAFFVGGGSVVLKDYIKAINDARANQGKNPYNIEFFEDEKESIWMMASAYYKLLLVSLKAKGVEVEVAATEDTTK